MGQALTPQPSPQTKLGPQTPPKKFYIPVKVKFFIASAIALSWFIVSFWLSYPWVLDLSTKVGHLVAWLIVLFIALIPGYLNAFLLTSLLLDRPPRLKLDRQDYPPLSILIAAYNEERNISETLRSIRQQDYPAAIEVIIVDDGSTDRTREVVLGSGLPNLKLMATNHGGKSKALNLGLAEVAHELVVTIDADTFLHPQALRRIVARMLGDPQHTAAIAGSVLAKNSRDTFMTRLQEWDYFLAIASVKRQQALYQGTLVAQGAFSLYKTKVLRSINGWPACIGEDIVLTWALIKAGYRIGFEPTAVGFTRVPVTFKQFARQRRRWARGMIEGFKYHWDMLLRRPRLVTYLLSLDLLFPLLEIGRAHV